jgi:hypothetical protein
MQATAVPKHAFSAQRILEQAVSLHLPVNPEMPVRMPELPLAAYSH